MIASILHFALYEYIDIAIVSLEIATLKTCKYRTHSFMTLLLYRLNTPLDLFVNEIGILKKGRG